MGVTIAFFQSSGTLPSSRDFWNMMLIGFASCCTVSARRRGGMLSGPAALLVFNPLRRRPTSCSEMVMSVRGSSILKLGGGGRFPSGLQVNTLWKKLFSTWALSLSVLAVDPSSLLSSAMPVLVLVFDFTYDQKDLGFPLACLATVASMLILAFLQALAALLRALAYST